MEQQRRIVPPGHFLIAVIAMATLHRWYPIARVLGPSASYAGVVMTALGFALAANAVTAFKRMGTPVIPFKRSAAPVTTGICRLTRNPMYLGLVVLRKTNPSCHDDEHHGDQRTDDRLRKAGRRASGEQDARNRSEQ